MGFKNVSLKYFLWAFKFQLVNCPLGKNKHSSLKTTERRWDWVLPWAEEKILCCSCSSCKHTRTQVRATEDFLRGKFGFEQEKTFLHHHAFPLFSISLTHIISYWSSSARIQQIKHKAELLLWNTAYRGKATYENLFLWGKLCAYYEMNCVSSEFCILKLCPRYLRTWLYLETEPLKRWLRLNEIIRVWPNLRGQQLLLEEE